MLKRLLLMSWVQIRRVPRKIKKNLVSPISSFHLRHPSQLTMISPIYVHLRYLSHSHFTTIQNYAWNSTDLNSAHSQLSRAVLTYFRAWVLAENKYRGKPDPTLSHHGRDHRSWFAASSASLSSSPPWRCNYSHYQHGSQWEELCLRCRLHRFFVDASRTHGIFE